MNILDKICFDDEAIEMMYQASKEKIKNQKDYFNSSTETLQKQFNLVQEKQSRLADSYLSQITPEAVYTQKMKKLNNEKINLELQIKNFVDNQNKGLLTLEQTKTYFLTANKAKNDYLVAKKENKRRVIEPLLWNLAIKDQKVALFQLKMPYQLMLTGHQNSSFETILRGLDSNQDKWSQSPLSYR